MIPALNKSSPMIIVSSLEAQYWNELIYIFSVYPPFFTFGEDLCLHVYNDSQPGGVLDCDDHHFK